MNACFLPQDDHLIPDVPERKNRPPRILESTVTPSRLQAIGNGQGCGLTFSLRVEDPDINDLITVRWYVDYSAGNPTQPVDEDVLDPGGRPQRNTSAEYLATVSSAANPLHPTGLHVVEAVVADGPLVGYDRVLPHPSPPDAGTTNLSYIVTYAWTVDVSPEDCLAP